MPKGISNVGLNQFANFVAQTYTQMPMIYVTKHDFLNVET